SAGGEPRRARRRVRPHPGVRTRSHAASLFHLPFDIWRGSPAPLRHAFIALNLLILLSVFVFHVGMRLSFLNALYFVVSTVTTTGYGDINPGRAVWWLTLYGCLLMMLGP